MDIRFDGQTILVSGARWGIGRRIAEMFLESGGRVFACDHVFEGLDVLEGKGARVAEVDLTDTQATNAWVAAIEAETGGPVRVAVNNAGGFGRSRPGAFLEVADEDWEATMAINLMTTVRLSRAVMPGMQTAGFGRIVNISSGAGVSASSTQNHAYTAAKHAVVGLTRQMAYGLGKYGVTVNSIAPGFVLSAVDTLGYWAAMSEAQKAAHRENIYMRRVGAMDDIAPAALYLASDYAGWVTGQTLVINGGRAV